MVAGRVLCVISILGLVAACSADGPDAGERQAAETSAPSAADAVPAETQPVVSEPSMTEASAPVPVSTDPEPPRELPAGALFLPSDLPEGWTVRTVRSFPRFEADGASDGLSRSYIAHRIDGGYEVGGATVTITKYKDAQAAADSVVGQLGLATTTVAVDGFGSGVAESDPDQSGLSTLAVERDLIGVSLIGSSPVAELVDIVEALQIDAEGATTGDAPAADLAFAGWVLDDDALSTGQYGLDVGGPSGTISIIVTPGKTRSSLYASGHDLTQTLAGAVGEGYVAVQRVEAEDVEYPRIVWWVPDVLLNGVPTDDAELVAGVLDSFIEVDAATFLDRTKDATFIEVEFDVTSPPADRPDADTPRPFDDERLDVLATFIEGFVGRTFDEPPEVALIDSETFTGAVPPGTFLTEAQWDLYRALGLVAPGFDRVEAESVRIEEIRGVCCPVQLVEQADPDFNEVVIVHELTHGLDTELRTGVSGSNEPLDTTRALVEGNAHRVAFAYADLLEESGADLPDPPAVFTNIDDSRLPDAIRELLEFPYDEGRLFAAALAEEGGEQAIVDAFADPPTTSEQILDLDAYLAGERGASVDRPDPADGSDALSTGSIGAFTLRLLLERSLDADAAEELALNWSGDRYSVYGDEDAPCVVATILMDDGSSAEAVAAALQSDPLDAVDNDVQLDGTSVSLTRCAAA